MMVDPSGTRLLLIEDGPDQAKSIKALLESGLGATVDVAGSYARARELIARGPYDAVVLDSRLPDGEGLEILEEMSSMEVSPPVIVIMEDGEGDIVVNALRLGVFGCLARGVDAPELLVETVQRAVSRGPRSETERSLHEQSKLLWSALNVSTDLFFVLDLEGRMLLWNDSVREVLGYSDEELRGRKVSDFREGEDKEVVERALDGVVDHSIHSGYEIELIARDGRRIPYEFSGALIHNDRGDPIAITGTGRDVTARRLAEEKLRVSEEALRRSEAQFRTLVENSNDIVAVVDRDGTIRFVSPSVRPVLGHDPALMVGRNAFEYLHADDAMRVLNTHTKAFEEPGRHYTEDVRMLCSDGSWRFTEVLGQALIEDGEAVNVLLNIRDISDRKQAEEWARMGRARAETLYRVSKELAGVGLDYSLTLRTISRNVAELIGDVCLILLVSADGRMFEVAAVEHQDTGAGDFAREVASAGPFEISDGVFAQVLTSGEPLLITEFGPEYSRTVAAEVTRPYREAFGIHTAIIVPLRFEGQTIGVLGSSRDTPDRPYTEEDQALLQDLADRAAMAIEMARLHKQVQDELAMRKEREEELEAANKELEGFAQTVSHDLKGPMTTMKLSLELLKERDTLLSPGDTEEMLDSLLRNAGKAYTLVENLLQLAESGQVPASLDHVDVGRTVRIVIDEVRSEFEEKPVTFDVDDDLGTLYANSTHVYQIFSNLIRNAVVHNENPDPRVWILCLGEDEAGAQRYLVKDNGGLPPDILERIFEPFVRGEGGGTGIGLAIVSKVVRVYNGSIRAYNDGGACFEFALKGLSV
jgi:PAS domain S-box-containing protein